MNISASSRRNWTAILEGSMVTENDMARKYNFFWYIVSMPSSMPRFGNFANNPGTIRPIDLSYSASATCTGGPVNSITFTQIVQHNPRVEQTLELRINIVLCFLPAKT